MKRRIFLFFIIQYLFCTSVSAHSLDLGKIQDDAIGEHLQLFQEDGVQLTLDMALKAYHENQFHSAGKPYLSFGIGAQPVWLQFTAVNATQKPLLHRLSIKTSWLDKIDVYFLRNKKLVKKHQLGDTLPYDVREVKNRYFDIDYTYPPGSTLVLIRVETPDPMVLPIYLQGITDAYSTNTTETYTYGFVYGVLIALLAYNLMLFFSLKSLRYLLYSFYLLSFFITNLAYTGHGFQWLWSESPAWQQWSNPTLMILFGVCGLLFAMAFLQTRLHLPTLHRVMVSVCLAVVGIFIIFLLLEQHVYALVLAFAFIFVFSISMVIMGGISLYKGNHAAKYFLAASITHVCMSMITAMTVWGIIPYSTLGFHAAEYGMVIDAILLSMALADQFKIINEQKLQAERLSLTDHLTGINNRRAFYELISPIWNTGIRNKRNMSVILMDVDRFKSINDTYGHAQGDKVLITLAKTLLNNARSGDIIARWGGEEFILFLPETTIDEATEIAERFRETVSDIELQNHNGDFKMSVSIGIAHNANLNMTIDDLIMIADKYLYKAKQKGRNQVCARHICD